MRLSRDFASLPPRASVSKEVGDQAHASKKARAFNFQGLSKNISTVVLIRPRLVPFETQSLRSHALYFVIERVDLVVEECVL